MPTAQRMKREKARRLAREVKLAKPRPKRCHECAFILPPWRVERCPECDFALVFRPRTNRK